MTFCIRKKNIGKFDSHNELYIRCLKNYTIDNFRKQLKNVDWFKVILCDNVDTAWYEFKTMFTNAIDHVAPVKLKRLKQRTEPWFDHTILESILERNHALHLFRLTGSSDLFDLYKDLRNKTQMLVKNAKETYYSDKVYEFKNNPKNLWNTIKSVGIPSKKAKTSNSNISLEINGNIEFDKKVVSNEFNGFFTTIASNLVQKLPTSTQKFSDCINFYFQKGIKPNSFKLSVVDEDQVLKLLNNINIHKATGLDSLPARFLKDGGPEIVTAFTHLLNLSIHSSKVPSDMKSARVVPLFKKQNKTHVGNYRPVSILSVASKILEIVVHEQLQNHLDQNELLFQHQSGFRPAYSTDTCLIHLTDHIKNEMDKGNITGMVLIDLQKAFDTVDHSITMHKLQALGADKATIEWFKSYLTGREQIVDVNGTHSTPQKINCGVPQGSILGPLLFLCYVNDMQRAVNCKLLLYADDSALIVPE